MDTPTLFIIKRDGKQEPFSPEKIENAIIKAYRASGIQENKSIIQNIVQKVSTQLSTETNPTVEEYRISWSMS